MSIFANKGTKIAVQGMTGTQGRIHTEKMLAFGSNIVAGISPGKGGQRFLETPLFDTLAEAKAATGCDASVVFVPPAFAADAILEAVDAELSLCVCITENIPVLDMIRVKRHMRGKSTRLVGPNCPGLVTPGECKLGIMPQDIHLPGHVGVVSRSGSLTYETIKELTLAGIGQSTSVGIGGDPVNGTSFLDAVQAFDADPDTYAVVMIGEIGGEGEQEAARWLRDNSSMPAVAFIAGRTAPKGKRMGHAGAVISGKAAEPEEKIRVLFECGIPVADISDRIGETLIKKLDEAGILGACRRG